MSKPKIYSFCTAGCKWETVHRSEFENNIPWLLVDTNTLPVELEFGKIYRVKMNEGGTVKPKITVEVKYTMSTGGGTTQVTGNLEIPLEFDEFTGVATFRVFSKMTETIDSSNYKNSSLTVTYEMNDVRKTAVFQDTTNGIKSIYYAKKLFVKAPAPLTTIDGKLYYLNEYASVYSEDVEDGSNKTFSTPDWTTIEADSYASISETGIYEVRSSSYHSIVTQVWVYEGIDNYMFCGHHTPNGAISVSCFRVAYTSNDKLISNCNTDGTSVAMQFRKIRDL